MKKIGLSFFVIFALLFTVSIGLACEPGEEYVQEGTFFINDEVGNDDGMSHYSYLIPGPGPMMRYAMIVSSPSLVGTYTVEATLCNDNFSQTFTSTVVSTGTFFDRKEVLFPPALLVGNGFWTRIVVGDESGSVYDVMFFRNM